MTVIDAQVHIWPADAPERPWPEYGRGHAHGDELSDETMLSLMDEAGIDRAVLVPPSWEGDRNDVCLAAAAAHPDRFAVMGRLPVELDASRNLLAGWLDQPGMLGVRLTFHRDFQRQWLRDGTVDWFWRDAEEIGLPVMVFVPQSVPEIADVARRYPGLKLVLDHLALYGTMDDTLLDVLDPVLRLAEYPNIAVKASCMPNLVTEDFPFPTLQEAMRRVVDAYGPERTFWGSDVSRLRCPLADCLALVSEACEFLNADEKDWILGRGVAQWLDWAID